MSLSNEQALARLRRTIPWAAVGLVGAVPATIAVSMAIDLIQKRGRKTRVAPRPGTFGSKVAHSQLDIYTDGATRYEDMIAAIGSAPRFDPHGDSHLEERRGGSEIRRCLQRGGCSRRRHPSHLRRLRQPHSARDLLSAA